MKTAFYTLFGFLLLILTPAALAYPYSDDPISFAYSDDAPPRTAPKCVPGDDGSYSPECQERLRQYRNSQRYQEREYPEHEYRRHYVHAKVMDVTIYPGSLRDNIKRIAAQFGWHQVVWDVENDYDWVGKTHLEDCTLREALKRILRNYPLHAFIYEGNHVIAIEPRTLR